MKNLNNCVFKLLDSRLEVFYTTIGCQRFSRAHAALIRKWAKGAK